jgi:hypothetical protein
VRGTRRGDGRVWCQILRRSSGGREVKSGNVDVEVDGGGGGFGCCGADVSGNEAGCGDASGCEVGIEFAYEGEG